MVLFLDESYETLGDRTVLAVGGVMIAADRYRHLLACVHRLRTKWFFDARPVREDRAAFNELRRRQIPIHGDPTGVELKAVSLLSPGAARHHCSPDGPTPGFELVAELLSEAAGLGVKVFGTLSEVSEVRAALHPADGRLPRQYAFLFERANGYVEREFPQRIAAVVLDSVHLGSDASLLRRTTDYLFRTEKGKGMRHILPAPLCVDSSITAGVQVADLVVALLRRAILPPAARLPWQPLIDQAYGLAVRKQDGRIYSIYRIWQN